MEQFEAVGNLVRTCRDSDGNGGFLVAEVQMQRPDAHELARLIAVSPRMLKELIFAADIIRSIVGNAVQVQRMDEVIAKATGAA